MPLLRDTAILDSINPTDPIAGRVDTDLDLAFNEGASPPAALPTDPPVIPPMGGYADFTSAIKQAVRQAYAQVMAAMAPTPWADLTLQGSWVVGTETPQARREGFDVVRLRGTVKGGTGAIATLDAALRPSQACSFAVPHGTTTDVGIVTVSTAGVINFATGDSSSVKLDGITFSTTPAG